MRLPGEPVSSYTHDGDADALAAWMLELLDKSPDQLAMVALPVVATDEAMADLENTVIEAYDIAKRERPDLGVKVMHQQIPNRPRGRIALQIHLHQWVGGECVNGCGETRGTT